MIQVSDKNKTKRSIIVITEMFEKSILLSSLFDDTVCFFATKHFQVRTTITTADGTKYSIILHEMNNKLSE